MKTAIHLGPNYTENFGSFQEHELRENFDFFGIIQKLILDRSDEILKVTPTESTAPSWTRSTLSHGQVIKWTKAKVRVYSDSVLCLEKISDDSEANRR